MNVIKRYVFLDTQVFIANNFNYSNESFSRLLHLVQEGKISLVTTTITINEITANIVSSISEAKNAINEFKKKARILKNCSTPSYEPIWERFDIELKKTDLLGQLTNFINNTNTLTIPLTGNSIQSIFEKYFSSLPPFKEGKKKYEFPDAFAIAALEQWSSQNNEFVYVISGDEDWKLACEMSKSDLVCYEKLEALFQLIEFDNKLIAKLSEDYFNNHLEKIVSTISDQFEVLGFDIDGSDIGRTIDDEEVEQIKAQNIELIEKYLVRINQNTLFYTARFKVTYIADLLYTDNTDAYYDNEEGQYFNGEDVQESITSSTILPVEIDISYSQVAEHSSLLKDVRIRENNIAILLDRDDEY